MYQEKTPEEELVLRVLMGAINIGVIGGIAYLIFRTI
jgi:hypothetical protein